MIRKIPRSCLGLFLLLRLRGVGATIRSATLMLIVALLATSPLPLSAATPDPVLEWIDVMNTTVLAAGTPPQVTTPRGPPGLAPGFAPPHRPRPRPPPLPEKTRTPRKP